MVFELVKDFDCTISKTLTHYLSKEYEGLDSLIASRLLALKEYLLNDCIVFVDINPSNIVLRKTSAISGELVIIDALGSHHFLPVSHYVGSIARSMIKRRWGRSIRNEYEEFTCRKNLKPIFSD